MSGIKEKATLIVLTFQTTVLILVAIFWKNVTTVSHPTGPPMIPGANYSEQHGSLIEKGWMLGLRYRNTILNNHADSWTGVAARFEGGKPWADVKAEWSAEYRRTRDDPFDVVVQPEIDLIMPPGTEPTPHQRHNISLFLKAFAEGLRDQR